MARKSTKICLVCGNEFKGTASAFTCSGACRVAMKRMLDNGKKPEYWMIAKNKGQKLPVFFQPPIPKQEKKEENLGTTINYTIPTEESYNGKEVSRLILDEVGKTETAGTLTKEEKLKKIKELEDEIKKINNQSMPIGMMPKSFALSKSMRIDDINDQIKKLQ